MAFGFNLFLNGYRDKRVVIILKKNFIGNVAKFYQFREREREREREKTNVHR